LVRAGESAHARAAHHEAAALFERAIAVLTREEATPINSAAIVDLRLQLHNALFPIGKLERALTNAEEAEQAAERLEDPLRLSRVLSRQTYLLGATGDLARAIVVGERALSLSWPIGMTSLRSRTQFSCSRALSMRPDVIEIPWVMHEQRSSCSVRTWRWARTRA
jgi:tetratricopeptide (TPR) repeat protein